MSTVFISMMAKRDELVTTMFETPIQTSIFIIAGLPPGEISLKVIGQDLGTYNYLLSFWE